MRTSNYRTPKNQTSLPWKWIVIVIAISVVFFLSKSLWDSSIDEKWTFLNVTPWSGGQVSILSLGWKKRDIEKEGKLFTSDASLSITAWSATIWDDTITLFMDKWWELSYKSLSWNIRSVSVLRWRSWIEPNSNFELSMKNLNAKIEAWDILLAEQQTQVYSILYVLKGDIELESSWRSYILTPGKRIMVSQSDLANPWTGLESLAGNIDDWIRQNPFFISHNGDSLLSDITKANASPEIQTGTVLSGSKLWGEIAKYIEIINPVDWSVISTDIINLEWKILSKDVKRISINGKDAVISPVNESFSLKWFPITSNTTDLIYRAYDAWGNVLERTLITIYNKSKTSGTEKLVPTIFPNGDKDFHITSPLENPYKTSESAVTVSGTVPKNSVDYITVNNFRLKKFVSNSTSWYYYANVGYETMKDGFNLYEIRFYWANDTLLSTQLFTIIKEPKWTSTVSWE